MKLTELLMITTVPLLLSGWANAQDSSEDAADDGELTMMLIPVEAELPEAVTKFIELPEPASESGVVNSAAGLARQGRQEGLETARDRGNQFGQDMADAAKDNRENVTRGGGQENRPDRPDPPGPPDDLPGPPNPPGPPGP